MRDLIVFILLFTPIISEVYRDRNGDVHPNSDWLLRGFLCVMVAASSSLIRPIVGPSLDFIRYFAAAVLFFTALFPYCVNFIHLYTGVTRARGFIQYKNATKKEVMCHTLSHLSRSAWPDKTSWWRNLGVGGRLLVNMILVLIACILL